MVSGAVSGSAAAAAAPPPSLAETNDVLATWLELIDGDHPFLVLDGSAGQLSLHHGAALLRADALVLATPVTAGVQHLQAHVRRHRRADPFHEIVPGPFDWEHYLVAAADDEVALWFDAGLLVYAADGWTPARAPSVRLEPGALRALYDALAAGTAIVVLPSGWDAIPEGTPP